MLDIPSLSFLFNKRDSRVSLTSEMEPTNTGDMYKIAPFDVHTTMPQETVESFVSNNKFPGLRCCIIVDYSDCVLYPVTITFILDNPPLLAISNITVYNSIVICTHP